MKLHRRVAVLGVVAALTVAAPTTAHAAGSGGKGKAKTKTAAAQQHKKAPNATAEAARKKKAEEARSRFTFPGKVVSVGTDSLQITRKERGVVVTRDFVVDAAAVIKRDGARIALADVQPGDRVVAHGRKVNGVLRVTKINVESAVVAPAPVETATPTAAIII